MGVENTKLNNHVANKHEESILYELLFAGSPEYGPGARLYPQQVTVEPLSGMEHRESAWSIACLLTNGNLKAPCLEFRDAVHIG